VSSIEDSHERGGGSATGSKGATDGSQSVVPILNVSDVTDSFAWFARLGWSARLKWKVDPESAEASIDFGSVVSGDCEIFLCRDGQGGRGRGSGSITGGPERDQISDKGVWLSIFVDDVDAAHRRCVTQGLEITYPPTNEVWGVREMHVRRPDGHVFRIGAVIDEFGGHQ
jgi:uncharacterized glyoxalase superfamily protein PhnB